MSTYMGQILFLITPVLLAGLLLWRFPSCRWFRWQSLFIYGVVMSLIIWAALQLVASIGSARVVYTEIAVVLWFTVIWRLAWELWTRTVGRWGDNWRRWARLRKHSGKPAPAVISLIPYGRTTLTGLIFIPIFFSMVVTHRCKLADGQDPYSLFNAPYEQVRIPTSDGLTLDGWFIPDSKAADRTILICHGAGANKGNFIWFLPPLLNRGYNLMLFDFRAHGGSDGRTTTYGIREKTDVLAAIDWLKKEKHSAARIIVGLGSSQGSFALALAAAEDSRIDAVVLDSPFISPRQLVRDKSKAVPVLGPLMGDLLLAEVSLQTATNFFSVSAESAVRMIGPRPVMVIHGDKDIMMPATHAQRLYEAAVGPKSIWFGPGPHSNIITESPSEYGQRLFAFLEANLEPVP